MNQLILKENEKLDEHVRRFLKKVHHGAIFGFTRQYDERVLLNFLPITCR